MYVIVFIYSIEWALSLKKSTKCLQEIEIDVQTSNLDDRHCLWLEHFGVRHNLLIFLKAIIDAIADIAIFHI